jgi:hypothetical protein
LGARKSKGINRIGKIGYYIWCLGEVYLSFNNKYRRNNIHKFINFIPPLIERGLYCNHLVCPSVRPSVHTFVTDISASTGRNDFIFDKWLWHGDLYRVSPFQVCRTSTSCLPCDLEFFMFAAMKTFVTDILASTGRNDFIFDMWLWHGDLYHVWDFCYENFHKGKYEKF